MGYGGPAWGNAADGGAQGGGDCGDIPRSRTGTLPIVPWDGGHPDPGCATRLDVHERVRRRRRRRWLRRHRALASGGRGPQLGARLPRCAGGQDRKRRLRREGDDRLALHGAESAGVPRGAAPHRRLRCKWRNSDPGRALRSDGFERGRRRRPRRRRPPCRWASRKKKRGAKEKGRQGSQTHGGCWAIRMSARTAEP